MVLYNTPRYDGIELKDPQSQPRGVLVHDNKSNNKMRSTGGRGRGSSSKNLTDKQEKYEQSQFSHGGF